MRLDKGLSWISWVACEGSAAVDLAPSPQVHTATTLGPTVCRHITHTVYNTHPPNVITHISEVTKEEEEGPLVASAPSAAPSHLAAVVAIWQIWICWIVRKGLSSAGEIHFSEH